LRLGALRLGAHDRLSRTGAVVVNLTHPNGTLQFFSAPYAAGLVSFAC
jgi:hypothetical protein